MASKKIQLYTDRANTIEASPETSANCVILSDGNDLQKVLDNDLTNPTAVHEETSFKVGVGDIDVSSSVVDGEVGRMVIKGKTYQNILPEPSTHVLTNNKEMFKVNEGLDPNVEIVDAVSKSAILSGNTLVNMCDDGVADASDIRRFTHNYTSNGGTFEQVSDGIKATTTQDNTWLIVGYDIRSQQKKMMTIGKKYYGVADVTIHKLSNSDSCKVIFRAMYGLRESKSLTDGRGLVQSVFTHGSDDANLGWLAVGTNGQKAVVGDSFTVHSMSVYEITDEEANLSYEELANKYPVKCVGMTSCKMPVLKTTGKNLCDTSKYIHGGLSNNNMIFSKNKYRSYYMKCKPSTVYTVKVENSNNRFGVGSSHLFSEDTAFTLNKYWTTPSSDVTGQTLQYTVTTTEKDEYLYVYVANNGVFNPDSRVQVEEGSVATTYEPYKSNILSTPEEVVLRSLPNGVKDTLNCMTGEYVQHIKEVVFDGSSDESIGMVNVNDTTLVRFNINNVAGVQTGNTNKVLCSSLPYLYIHGLSGGSATVSQECISNHSQDANVINIVIKRSRLSSVDVAGFRAYLQSNPITIQYSIATPIVKTVDLSSSGNWEKVVYNGMESWNKHDTWSSGELLAMHTSCRGKLVGGLAFSDKFDGMKFSEASSNSVATKECIRYDAGSATIYVFIKKSRLQESSIDGFKQWLKDNGLTVWYQTETHLDSTQVKQPIFFKDGHIIQTSGTDNSLIPTLDYQAKTSNSYVMDLMKANTRYTMKAKSASGTFTIDGTSYGAGTNGTFTTPSSMTNKFLVMSNKTNEEVMILEGDVTDKTIPYFKGIKSAFENESKIEVLSSNCANLFHPKDIVNDNYWELDVTGKAKIFLSAPRRNAVNMVQRDSNGIELMARVNEVEDQIEILPNAKTLRLVGGCFRPTDAWHELITQNLIVADAKSENNTKEIDYKSNSTKIPLLSPLRSLPNGVCDELIIDRMKKKATLIQRVGELVQRGQDVWNATTANLSVYYWNTANMGNANVYVADNLIPNMRCREMQVAKYSSLIASTKQSKAPLLSCRGNNASHSLAIFNPYVEDVTHHKEWLQANPITVQYELLNPVVTEIDLENFPLVYKDGHIFLNSEIAPVVEIDYNVNQAQQIQANNETLQRHELDILDLDNLIVSFVNAEYNLRLLKFDMELSMMALAE